MNHEPSTMNHELGTLSSLLPRKLDFVGAIIHKLAVGRTLFRYSSQRAKAVAVIANRLTKL
jgi:hypothetical protein